MALRCIMQCYLPRPSKQDHNGYKNTLCPLTLIDDHFGRKHPLLRILSIAKFEAMIRLYKGNNFLGWVRRFAFVQGSHGLITGGSNEDIFGASVSDDDGGGDADPIPTFLLPDGVGPGGVGGGARLDKSKKSPLMFRQTKSSPPTIIKASLKNFSGLEGVTPGMLSTQDSIEATKALNNSTTAGGSSTAGATVITNHPAGKLTQL